MNNSSPLVQNVFDAKIGRVKKLSDSDVLQGHFDNTLSIVPLVALKAHRLLNMPITGGLQVNAVINSAVLPGASLDNLDDSLQIKTKDSGREIFDIVHPARGKEENEEKGANPLYIPQNGVFRLADYGKITKDSSVAGYCQISADFLWHDNNGAIDPFILEEIAAQIITYAYSARAGIQARNRENGELNSNFPLLTFKTSEVRYHVNKMPTIKDCPKIVLVGKILQDEKREARVVYTLYTQYNQVDGMTPLISGAIIGNKATIALMKRAIKSGI